MNIGKDDVIKKFADQLNDIIAEPIIYLETPIAHVLPPNIVSKDMMCRLSAKNIKKEDV